MDTAARAIKLILTLLMLPAIHIPLAEQAGAIIAKL
jgi:hypothetical protein